jgi:hypothetical protein
MPPLTCFSGEAARVTRGGQRIKSCLPGSRTPLYESLNYESDTRYGSAGIPTGHPDTAPDSAQDGCAAAVTVLYREHALGLTRLALGSAPHFARVADIPSADCGLRRVRRADRRGAARGDARAAPAAGPAARGARAPVLPRAVRGRDRPCLGDNAGLAIEDPWLRIVTRIQASAPVRATLPGLRSCAARYGWPAQPYGAPDSTISSFGDFVTWVAGYLDGAVNRGLDSPKLERHWAHVFVKCGRATVAVQQRLHRGW